MQTIQLDKIKTRQNVSETLSFQCSPNSLYEGFYTQNSWKIRIASHFSGCTQEFYVIVYICFIWEGVSAPFHETCWFKVVYTEPN